MCRHGVIVQVYCQYENCVEQMSEDFKFVVCVVLVALSSILGVGVLLI